MLSKVICLTAIVAICVSEMTVPGIDRTYSTDGVRSLGYNVVYGDEDMTVINQVVDQMDSVLKRKNVIKEAIPVMPAEDVKCLMSVDRYCSKEMLETKKVLIHAVKEDCASCTEEEKENAGRVIASMLAHDHVAWKMFLTRYDGLEKVQRILG